MFQREAVILSEGAAVNAVGTSGCCTEYHFKSYTFWQFTFCHKFYEVM